MRFADIVGLNEIKEKLVNGAHRNHHAQIFSGPSGSANLALALAYTSYINCEHPSATDSCGECAACSKIEKFVHPDFHLTFPISSTTKWKGSDVVSSNFMPDWRDLLSKGPYIVLEDWVNTFGGENKQVNISKEESRQIIQKLTLKSFEAKFKVMLIWLPEWMHPSAANGILKILEEPPSNTVFLLVTNNYEKLLTTITSRAQLVNIRAFNHDEVVTYLNSLPDHDVQKSSELAKISEGNLQLARSLSNQDNDKSSNQVFSTWMRSSWQADFDSLITMADDFHSMTKISQKSLISNGLTILRNALLANNKVANNIIAGSVDDFEIKFGNAVTPEKIEIISNELSESYYHLERNASAKMTFLDLSLRISTILRS